MTANNNKSALKVFNDSGTKSVDWWFLYKLPHDVKPQKGAPEKYKKTNGMEYLYFDAGQVEPLSLSNYQMDKKEGALFHTLNQLYSAKAADLDSLGWICYNDEIPNTKKNDDRKGHSKGVLAFDVNSDTAFWLLHSWPKFPDIKTGAPGSSDYGQTFICIQLESIDELRTIATQMYHHQEPQVYDVQLPKSIKKDDILYKVATDVDVDEKNPASDVAFKSLGQQAFRLMAKNRHWDKDFWIDLVGPHLHSNIEVETWRRGTVPGTEDSDQKDRTIDALYIDLSSLGIPYEWHYTKDHAKWGATITPDWICVADINRQTSQEKRGGGTICLKDKILWKNLKGLEKLKK